MQTASIVALVVVSVESALWGAFPGRRKDAESAEVKQGEDVSVGYVRACMLEENRLWPVGHPASNRILQRHGHS